MVEYIALLRGINVGRAKRIAMADLRNVVAGLGYTEVRTILNSGNVLFKADRANTKTLAKHIQEAIAAQLGLSAQVLVLTATDLAAIIQENPLKEMINDPSRFLVAFISDPSLFETVQPMTRESWTPDQLAIGSKAIYLWCESGVLESKLPQAFSRLTKDKVTTRNWATVLRLQGRREDEKDCGHRGVTGTQGKRRWSNMEIQE